VSKVSGIDSAHWGKVGPIKIIKESNGGGGDTQEGEKGGRGKWEISRGARRHVQVLTLRRTWGGDLLMRSQRRGQERPALEIRQVRPLQKVPSLTPRKENEEKRENRDSRVKIRAGKNPVIPNNGKTGRQIPNMEDAIFRNRGRWLG